MTKFLISEKGNNKNRWQKSACGGNINEFITQENKKRQKSFNMFPLAKCVMLAQSAIHNDLIHVLN